MLQSMGSQRVRQDSVTEHHIFHLSVPLFARILPAHRLSFWFVYGFLCYGEAFKFDFVPFVYFCLYFS